METQSRKRLRLDNSLLNNDHDKKAETEHQEKVDNSGNEMNIPDIVKLYDNGEYTQDMLDQALSMQEHFIYLRFKPTLDRVIGFLFKCELTKVVDILKTAYKNSYSDLMKYYKIAPVMFPQILAQLCPNIIEFGKMNLSIPTHVAFMDEYKKNVVKYSDTGLNNIPKNKFAGYMDRFVNNMPHLIEMMMSKMGIDGVKVMMEAFGCKQETIESMFNLVKEFKIKIDDTKLTDKQRRQKMEETVALLLKCPNTKTVDISLVSQNHTFGIPSSAIVQFFNSMPSSFTQAFAQLCPRIEKISNDGNLIFDTQLFASYGRCTNRRCNLTHVNLLEYRKNSKQLQYYVDSCSKIKSLEISFDICNLLIEERSGNENKNLLDKLKHVEEMKLESGKCRFKWGLFDFLDRIDFEVEFMYKLTALKKLDLRLEFLRYVNIKEIFLAINSLPSLTYLHLHIYNTECLQFIRPSLIKKLSIHKPQEMNSITNLSNLQSLTLIEARNDIIPFVSQLNSTMLFNLKHIKIEEFTGDCMQLFSAAIALSQNIKFDFFHHYRFRTSLRDVLRYIINARHTVFNNISLRDFGNRIIEKDHAIVHEAITKLDSSRVRSSFHLLLNLQSMKIVQRCKDCQQLLAKNTIFNIYKI